MTLPSVGWVELAVRVTGAVNRVTERQVGDSRLYEIKVLDIEAGTFDVVTAWSDDLPSVPGQGEMVHYAVEQRERAGKGGVVYKSLNVVGVVGQAEESAAVEVPKQRARASA